MTIHRVLRWIANVQKKNYADVFGQAYGYMELPRIIAPGPQRAEAKFGGHVHHLCSDDGGVHLAAIVVLAKGLRGILPAFIRVIA